MLRSLLLPMLALVVAAMPAQDESKTLSAFKKAFAEAKGKKSGASLDDKRRALRATSGLDSSKVAATLVAGWKNFDDELTALDDQRKTHRLEMAEIIKGQESLGNRTFPRQKLQRLNELKTVVGKLRAKADEMRELQLALNKRIGNLQRRDSVLWLLKKVCGHNKAALPLKLAAAQAVGAASSEIVAELATALTRARQVPEQIVLLDAMALAGANANPYATPVIKLLASKEPAVAERAALALAKMAIPEAIEPMIGLLARSSGQMKLRVVAALEVLTDEEFGSNVGAWRAWWQAEGASIASGDRAFGKGTPSNRKQTNENYYFGIPQSESDAILYVLDCSGSMQAPVRLKTGETTAGGEPAETTRLEACKTELIRALGKLNPKQKFAIMWYNDLPHWWQPKMQLAGKQAVQQAQEFVRGLKHASSTNIHDSLELGFTLVGRGAHDKYYGVELDTIFLLTDGSPTKPEGGLDSTDKILLAVKTWNPLKRITIHAIAIGRGVNEPFLRQLASDNGGEFKRF